MTAICGFAPAELPGEAASNNLAPMLTALHDYGDAASRWANGGAALGLRSDLAVLGRRIALRTDAAAGLAVAADARLDNRGELCSAFGLRPSERGAIDDAELVLRAFKRWGRDCADRLLGDFAFAVYDERKRELFLARDPVGVRPLYYALGERRLVFGTSVESVLAAEDVRDELDEVMIADTLTRPFMKDKEAHLLPSGAATAGPATPSSSPAARSACTAIGARRSCPDDVPPPTARRWRKCWNCSIGPCATA